MSKVLITRSKLDGLATTIAAKSGATLPLTIAQMDAAVDGIVVGGGDSYTRTVVVPQQTVTPNSSRTATFTSTEYFADGEYYIVTLDGTEYIVTAETLWSSNVILGDAQVVWSTSDVLYPFALITDGSAREGYFTTTSQHTIKVEHLEFVDGPLTIIPKSVTANGTYSASSDNADGYSSVTVNVPSGGTDTSQDTVDAAHLLDGYTAHDSTGSAIVGTYTPPTFATQSKTATPTTSQQTVTPDSGYDGLSSVTVNAIPSEYIIPSGSQTKTENGTYDVTALAQLVVNVASPVKTATGTFTGNGTRTIDVTCNFEPDIVYFTSDPGTTASSGTVAAIIVRGMMTATRYRNNSTTNSHYAIPDITGLNTSGSSYSWRATYDSTNSKLTLYCYSSNARGLLTNGRTYTYTLIKWT